MQKTATNPYLKTRIMTASPEELRLMLFDGAIKFSHQAKAELMKDKRDYEAVYENFMRAQKIVLELSTSLNYQANPELCEKLGALYTWVYRLLVDANMERDTTKIDEAVKLLEYERETWAMLMEKNAELAGKLPPSAQPVPAVNTYAQQTAMSTYAKSA